MVEEKEKFRGLEGLDQFGLGGHSHKGEVVVDADRGRGEGLKKEQLLKERHEWHDWRIGKGSV